MDWLSEATAFDILVLIIFLAFFVRGIWIGFIGQISSLIAMVGAFVLAGYFDNDFYGLILPYLKNSHIAFLITYIVLFVVFFFVIKLAGLGLRLVMDLTLVAWFDRTVGAIFGIIKGLFFISLIFVVISSFLSGSNNYLKKSITYPYLSMSSKVILAFIRDNDLRSYFIPKEPAIKLSSDDKKKAEEQIPEKAKAPLSGIAPETKEQ